VNWSAGRQSQSPVSEKSRSHAIDVAVGGASQETGPGGDVVEGCPKTVADGNVRGVVVCAANGIRERDGSDPLGTFRCPGNENCFEQIGGVNFLSDSRS
jgi:hypothetical protein